MSFLAWFLLFVVLVSSPLSFGKCIIIILCVTYIALDAADMTREEIQEKFERGKKI
jgi:hypothetical protein